MKCIKTTLSNDIKQLEILPISDLHIGTLECCIGKIQDLINRVRDNENTYCVLIGDIFDNSIIGSVGDVYEQDLTPMGQLAYGISLFEPIKHKILSVVQGNHEARSYKNTGIDLMGIFCAQLGILDKYDPVATCLFLRFGEMNSNTFSNGKRLSQKGKMPLYTIYSTHGISGGRTVGAKANALERVSNVIDSDICIVGHTHLPMTFRTNRYVVDAQNSSVYQKETIFINTASTQGYGGYAEKMSLKPSSMVNPRIILSGTMKKIEVVM